jgi:hypothetical protein
MNSNLLVLNFLLEALKVLPEAAWPLVVIAALFSLYLSYVSGREPLEKVKVPRKRKSRK